MGNGDEASGDGWYFRGRGIKQLTGRDNYTAFGKSVGMTAEKAAEYCATKKGAVESAAWFWKTNNLSRFADAGDIVGLTKAINGGTIGIDDRKKRYTNAVAVLSENSAPAAAPKPVVAASVKRGDRGETVAKIQTALGLKADGVFGIATEVSLKVWQSKNGMKVDGIATPDVIKKLVG
jgi:putative chitinase